ncbi:MULTISPECIES: hypothetical protein [Pseudomonas]|uniref:Secreted protein n=1 Tax=Pseudomonas izuensis TaxID=2684212 RepID=A0ABM7RNJ1_9PSED|nr:MULTISPECIES: hypothetical protein [Pseudomonas]BCX66783.1 hypothetical protein LAB08_R14070 [Pseudomonas izuensis]
MSNTLIAWAAFYPFLPAAFGGRAGGARKSSEGLNFPGFRRTRVAARLTTPTIFDALGPVKIVILSIHVFI